MSKWTLCSCTCKSYVCIYGPMLLTQLLPKPPLSRPFLLLPSSSCSPSFSPSYQSLYHLSPRGASCFFSTAFFLGLLSIQETALYYSQLF